MYNIAINTSNHEWSKQNLVTLTSRRGGYDQVACIHCKMKGKRFGFETVEVSETYSKQNVMNCPKAPKKEIPRKVRVTRCTANGEVFSNLKPNSEHDVIEPPIGYKNDQTGVWVMGVGEPVKLLTGEFTEI